MNRPPAILPAPTAAVPCRRCRYDLRGLRADGRCPECGLAVALSLGGDRLRDADPAWVATLARGTAVLFWTVVAVVADGLVSTLLLPAFRHSLAGLLVGIGCQFAGLAGEWLVTTPDPGGRGDARYGTSRRLVRVAVGVGLARPLLTVVGRTVTLPPPAYLATTILGQAVSAVAIVGRVARLHYLGKLARRIPDHTLADRARLLVFGLGIPVGVFEVAQGVEVVVRLSGGRRSLVAWVPVVGICGGLGILAFGPVYLWLLRRLTTRLNEEAAEARRAWAGPPSGPRGVVAR